MGAGTGPAGPYPRTLRPAGFEGALCELNVDDCSPDPCHHGRCVDGIASFSCACAPGYTGMRCESQVDECRSQPCQHGGKCLDLVDKYLCRCPPGTTGGAGLKLVAWWEKHRGSGWCVGRTSVVVTHSSCCPPPPTQG